MCVGIPRFSFGRIAVHFEIVGGGRGLEAVAASPCARGPPPAAGTRVVVGPHYDGASAEWGSRRCSDAGSERRGVASSSRACHERNGCIVRLAGQRASRLPLPSSNEEVNVARLGKAPPVMVRRWRGCVISLRM